MYQPASPASLSEATRGNPSFPRRRPPSALPFPSPPPRATAGQSPGSAGGGGASPWCVLLSPPGGGASYPGGGLAAWSGGLRATSDRRRPDLSLPSGTPLRLRASRPLLCQSTSGLQPSTAPRLTAPVLHLRQSGTASVAAVDCISVGLHLRQLCKFTCGRPISTRQLRQHHNMWHLRSLEMEAGEEQGERGVVDEGSVVSTCSPASHEEVDSG